MRIEPPVEFANLQIATEDITIGSGEKQVALKAGTKFFLSMIEMHHDPSVWKNPSEYIPDRFNKESEWASRPDGKQRSAQAFNPFMGGKRICMGKTLAEVIIRFTVPIIFHHL